MGTKKLFVIDNDFTILPFYVKTFKLKVKLVKIDKSLLKIFPD